ncbi:hypothetical protein [Coprothermobacter platensis]|jgi:cell shape-determining protein MreC|uniref:hypothetical protein n=1 Tax=Coprothermobacter platensis TaxID=108819 RepID=UPI0003A97797|nr:hypothetical protein [Coprothermobacter platensis]
MSGVGDLLEQYSKCLDDVIESISNSQLESVSKYVLALQDIITLIAQQLEEHPEEKHQHEELVAIIHEKQQKILALLEVQAHDLLHQVDETTTSFQVRKAYEQNKDLR